ncbi:MAG: protein-glutamate O-methyltransferase CheR [Alphaproteobacteria bacterium]|nr:MAG: protein-glutamate O-methyltransferase CheR [Alphaproteobacteria bacterium]
MGYAQSSSSGRHRTSHLTIKRYKLKDKTFMRGRQIMQAQEFAFIRNLVKTNSGIDLTEDKVYLLESRLMPIASKGGHKDLSAFVGSIMRSKPSNLLVQEIVEAMTTNESLFFRDTKPFQYLKDVVLHDFKTRGITRPLSIWCAACSSGQEPYSIAMTMEEQRMGVGSMGASILASDIDQQILKKAEDGIYNQFEVQRGLPMPMLIKHFSQMPEQRWKIKDNIKKMVTFKQHNLLNSARPHGMFDIIFCRNVLIYFDPPTKQKALMYLNEVLNPGGYLFLGSAETVPPALTMLVSHPEHRQLFIKSQ